MTDRKDDILCCVCGRYMGSVYDPRGSTNLTTQVCPQCREKGKKEKVIKMKIGVMGTHGVGKTALTYQVASKIKRGSMETRVSVLSEIARSNPFPINKNTTELSQRWIFLTQMLNEIEYASQCDTLVCDRTILDNIAYALNAGFYDLERVLHPLTVEWMSSYDLIYFVRPDLDHQPLSDGVRDTSEEFQKRIDEILYNFIYEQRFYTLPGSLREGTYDDLTRFL